MKIHPQRLLQIRVRFALLSLILFQLFAFFLYQIKKQEDILALQEHEALAERIFDELEGELLRFLQTEEAKEASIWSNYTKQTPAEPFVLSYFQISENEQISSTPSQDQAYLSKVQTNSIPIQSSSQYQQAYTYPIDTKSAQKMLNRSSKGRVQSSKTKLKPFQSFTSREKTILFREVTDQYGETMKQGLILDTKILQKTIAERVLKDLQATDYQDIKTGNHDEWLKLYWKTTKPAGDEYVFNHLFSHPFSQLHAEAHIQPLSLSINPWLSSSLFGIISMLLVSLSLWSLYRRQYQTEETAKLQSDFVGAVSHELRTPITAIQLYSEMLSQEMVSDEKKLQYYQTINSEAYRLSLLVEDILLVSNLNKKNEAQLSPDGVFSDVIEAIEARFSVHLEQKGFLFNLDISDEAMDFSIPVESSIQVLSNLIDNARKFSQDPPLEISIEARKTPNGLRVLVLDRGPGIPSSKIKKVRNLFVRGEDEQTRKTKGTGIGLAIVDGLMTEMGGSFSLYNREAGGLCAECIWTHKANS